MNNRSLTRSPSRWIQSPEELIESLSSVVINASTCLRRLEKDPPNVEGARETARRTIRDSNRAAEAVHRLSTLFYEKK